MDIRDIFFVILQRLIVKDQIHLLMCKGDYYLHYKDAEEIIIKTASEELESFINNLRFEINIDSSKTVTLNGSELIFKYTIKLNYPTSKHDKTSQRFRLCNTASQKFILCERDYERKTKSYIYLWYVQISFKLPKTMNDVKYNSPTLNTLQTLSNTLIDYCEIPFRC